jgi:hypothetical protein
MDTLTRTRQEIDTLLANLRSVIDAHAAQRAAELQQQELAIAAGNEAATMAAMDSSAYQRGANDKTQYVLLLIEAQLQALPHSSPTRTVLHTLSRMVEGQP